MIELLSLKRNMIDWLLLNS